MEAVTQRRLYTTVSATGSSAADRLGLSHLEAVTQRRLSDHVSITNPDNGHCYFVDTKHYWSQTVGASD